MLVIVDIPLIILVVRGLATALRVADPGIGATSNGFTPFLFTPGSLPELLLIEEDILGGRLDSFLTY